MGNIQSGKLDWMDLVYTSDDNEILKYSLQPNTVLFNRTNSPELVGKTAIYRGERPAIFAGYLIRINPFLELDPEYLNLCLNTNYSKEFCAHVKTDGVSQSNINAQKLGAFEVPFCLLAEQQEIVRRVEALFALADNIEQRYKKAQAFIDKLTPSLLAKAFRGELVPQDPNDEPASVLLERIKAERKKENKSNRKGVRGRHSQRKVIKR
jgi:type I restriction enzyme S subunit